MDYKKEIGTMFAQMRKKKGISQKKLSQITNIAQPDISNIENGYRSVGIELLNKLVEAIDCEIKIIDKSKDLSKIIKELNK